LKELIVVGYTHQVEWFFRNADFFSVCVPLHFEEFVDLLHQHMFFPVFFVSRFPLHFQIALFYAFLQGVGYPIAVNLLL
jgi:hypothetical protein